MRKAYVEIFDIKQQRRISHKFEENNRINVAKMLTEYTLDILGKNAAIFPYGEKSCFAAEIDDGDGITIYQGDLRKFQDCGLNGLEKMQLDKFKVNFLQRLCNRGFKQDTYL